MKRHQHIYATDRQMAFLRSLLNQCAVKRIDLECSYNLNRSWLKSEASSEIDRLLRLLNQETRVQAQPVAVVQTVSVGDHATIEGRRVKIVSISSQKFMGRDFFYYKVNDGRGDYSYNSETISRLGGWRDVNSRRVELVTK